MKVIHVAFMQTLKSQLHQAPSRDSRGDTLTLANTYVIKTTTVTPMSKHIQEHSVKNQIEPTIPEDCWSDVTQGRCHLAERTEDLVTSCQMAIKKGCVVRARA